MRLCSGPGCGRKVNDDVRYCTECQAERKPITDNSKHHTFTDRVRYAHLYSSKRWTKLSTRVRNEQPMCVRCNVHVTELIDHVVPAGVAVQQAIDSGRFKLDRNAGFFIKANLQGLCRPCHWIKTEEDKSHVGAWPNVITLALQSPRRVWTF